MHDNHLSSQKAQTTAEYALIISLTAVFIIIVLAALGVKLSSIYCGVVGLFGNTPSQCATGQLLFDPFDNLNAWSFPTGNGWKNVDDQLCSTAGGENRAFTGDENWTNYTVQADQAKMTQGNGYGIYFRASHEPSINGYVFQYDPGYKGGPYVNGAFLIRKVVNGNETPPLAVTAAPTDFKWTDTTRQITVDVRGDTFTAKVDGQQILQAHDSQFPSGRVGVRSWDDTRACFDNFSVSS